jgi:hypothetical protein
MFRFIITLAVAYVVGVFGFAQIIGSFRTFHIRGPGASMFTIILWSVILFGVAKLLLSFLGNETTALWIGYGISCVQMLMQRNIE